jgi:ubiquinone/menaquinone biosynthesis C-methylase UbiE
VASLYCGVGNPFSLGNIHPGEQILDIGCGAGVDAIVAAILTGPNGQAFGVDIVPEMIRQAKTNRAKTGLENAHFQETSGEALPFDDEVFDAVISNGAINLMPDKERALSEAFRVMKVGGRLMIADQVSSTNAQKDLKSRVDSWFQ